MGPTRRRGSLRDAPSKCAHNSPPPGRRRAGPHVPVTYYAFARALPLLTSPRASTDPHSSTEPKDDERSKSKDNGSLLSPSLAKKDDPRPRRCTSKYHPMDTMEPSLIVQNKFTSTSDLLRQLAKAITTSRDSPIPTQEKRKYNGSNP